MSAPTVNVTCSNGTFTLQVDSFSGTGYVWVKYYTGTTNPITTVDPNPYQSGGTAAWSQVPYTSSTNLSTTITPGGGLGVIAVAWALPNNSSTFDTASSAFVPACNVTSTTTTSTSSSSSSTSSTTTPAMRPLAVWTWQDSENGPQWVLSSPQVAGSNPQAPLFRGQTIGDTAQTPF